MYNYNLAGAFIFCAVMGAAVGLGLWHAGAWFFHHVEIGWTR